MNGIEFSLYKWHLNCWTCSVRSILDFVFHMLFLNLNSFLVSTSVVADSCVAMDEWVQHPTAHTALDDILPCVDNATAQETLLKSKNVTRQLVGLVDNIIQSVANSNLPPQAGPLYYNQSGPMVPLLCNPFNTDLTDHTCAAGEVELSNATEVIL